jgi:hypothetical protein
MEDAELTPLKHNGGSDLVSHPVNDDSPTSPVFRFKREGNKVQEKHVGYVVDPPIVRFDAEGKEGYYVFIVNDSMYPTLRRGDLVPIKRFKPGVKDIDENAPSELQHKEEDIFLPTTHIDDSLTDAQRAFDKSIITLKIALSRLATIIDECDDSSIVHEMLMHHKGVLHEQIGLLLKEKKKARNRYVG